VSVDVRKPFGEFLYAAMLEYRKDCGGNVSPKMWVEKCDEAHAAWHRARKPRQSPKVVSAEAEVIFALYPKKVAKQAALRAIVKALERLPGDILGERVRNYAGYVARWRKDDRAFVPNPATWFNEGRYDDDPKEWERPNMAPASVSAPAKPAGPMKEPPEGWALRLKSTGSDSVYAAGGTCNRDGACAWASIDPYYQRAIWKELDAIV
jgi:hypothetical protein